MSIDHTENEQEMNDGVEAAGRPEDDDAIVLNEFVSAENEREDANTAGVLRSSETEGDFPDTNDKWTVDVGVDVVGSCGHKIGEVVDVRDDYVIVEKGFFIPEDVFVPKSAISGADDHHLTLNVTKDYATHCDWDEDPEDRITTRQEKAS
jgi:hypothetical protein